MRIAGGQASGLRIFAPSGQITRPTGQRVREAVFNRLASVWPDSNVLDLYAGSGALGLEALSWGARSCVSVEPDRRAMQVIRKNVALMHAELRMTLLSMTAESAAHWCLKKGKRFTVIFCDPPWRMGISNLVRNQLHRILETNGIVIVEHGKSGQLVEIPGLTYERTKWYGDTGISFYQLTMRGE